MIFRYDRSEVNGGGGARFARLRTSPAHRKLNNPCRRDSNLEFFLEKKRRREPTQHQPQSLPDRNGRRTQGNVQPPQVYTLEMDYQQNTYVYQREQITACADFAGFNRK